MKLEDIQDQWEKDCIFDRTELGEESLKIPQLHSKYFKLFSHERLTQKKLEKQYKSLYKVKHEYYTGTISFEDLNSYGWEPNPLKILKSDISIYLEADEDLMTISLRMDYQKEKIDFLENIIRNINNRNYQIKNAIEWERFKVGS